MRNTGSRWIDTIYPNKSLHPFHHPHPNHLPQNHRDDTSGDETVAGCLQSLSEEEIGDGWEHDIRKHSVKRHNAGVFCNVEVHFLLIGVIK